MALLAGRREIAEIARFATSLTQPQRCRLGLPLKKGTGGFHPVPGYSVFYQVLTRMDPEAFAARLTDWLQAQSGLLPQALALDGKRIRHPIGLLTLAQQEDGAPQAVAVHDQKQDTPRCEQSAAVALLEKLPALDGKIITTDPLLCQRRQARLIGEKGAITCLGSREISLVCSKRRKPWTPCPTPFLPTTNPVMAGSKPAGSMPSPSSPWPSTSPLPAP